MRWLHTGRICTLIHFSILLLIYTAVFPIARSKGRTIIKVMGGGGGRGIFEPQEFFF